MDSQTRSRTKTRLGGFELLEKVADGSTGAVYKAREVSLNRIVALKILPSDLAQDAEFVAYFESQARAAAQLKHPHLMAVYAAGEADGAHYIVLEHVEADTVAAKVWRDGPLEEAIAAGICFDVAQALRYAWDKGRWVHGDLKPTNLLLERGSNKVRLAELGSGKSRFGQGEGSSHSDLAYSMATPTYVSPERAAGTSQFDFRADMYSLGAILYQMLTGKIPFEGLASDEVLNQQLHGFLPDPRTLRPELSESVVTVLERLLARDPVNRYSNWAVLAHDLSRIQKGQSPSMPRLAAGLSTLQRMPSRTQPAQPKRKRSLAPLAIAALVAIAVVAAVYLFFLLRREHEPTASQAPGPAETNAASVAATGEPSPSAEEAAAASARAEQEKTDREAEAGRREEEEKTRRLAEQTAREAEAQTRYDAWRPSFETLLASREFDQAVEAVAKAQADPQLEPVKTKLDGDENLARSLVRLRETAWQNFPGQSYAVGAASGVVTRVEGDKLWVKMAAGEIAVPKSSVEAGKLCAAALSKTPDDPQLTLAAGMFAWYHGDKQLARTLLTAAVKAGANPSFELPLDVLSPGTSPSAFALGTATPTPARSEPSESSETPSAADGGSATPKQPAQIDIVVKKGLKRGFAGTDYDNQRDVMSFTVTIKNKEFRTDYPKLTADLYVYGRSTTTQQFQMLLKKQSKEFNLPHGGNYEFDGGTLNLEYDEHYTAKFGVKYAGFVLVIRDESGAILKSKATNQSFVQHLDKLNQLGEGAYFESSLLGGGSGR